MKNLAAVLIAVLAFNIVAFSADSPAGRIDLVNMPVDKVLMIYQDLSGSQLLQSSEVKRMHSNITVHSNSQLSKAETLKLIEKALLDQAGIVITPVDDKKISVTYNDALTNHAAK